MKMTGKQTIIAILLLMMGMSFEADALSVPKTDLQPMDCPHFQPPQSWYWTALNCGSNGSILYYDPDNPEYITGALVWQTINDVTTFGNFTFHAKNDLSKTPRSTFVLYNQSAENYGIGVSVNFWTCNAQTGTLVCYTPDMRLSANEYSWGIFQKDICNRYTEEYATWREGWMDASEQNATYTDSTYQGHSYWYEDRQQYIDTDFRNDGWWSSGDYIEKKCTYFGVTASDGFTSRSFTANGYLRFINDEED